MLNFPEVTFYIITIEEVGELLEKYFDRKYENENTWWVAEMSEDSGYRNDTIQTIVAETKECRVVANHKQFLKKVKTNKTVEWNWELNAVFTDLADKGEIPYGEYILYLVW